MRKTVQTLTGPTFVAGKSKECTNRSCQNYGKHYYASRVWRSENNGISNVEIKSLPLRTIVFYKSKSLPQSGKFVPNLRMFE
jgi:hypothetical protein